MRSTQGLHKLKAIHLIAHTLGKKGLMCCQLFYLKYNEEVVPYKWMN